MIHKRLSPEERRGVFAVIIIALLIILLGFCHKCVRGNYYHGDSMNEKILVEDESPSGQHTGDNEDSTFSDGSRVRGYKSGQNKGRIRKTRGTGRKRKSRYSGSDRWVERDYLTDTIP